MHKPVVNRERQVLSKLSPTVTPSIQSEGKLPVPTPEPGAGNSRGAGTTETWAPIPALFLAVQLWPNHLTYLNLLPFLTLGTRSTSE